MKSQQDPIALSERVLNLSESATLAMAQKANDLKSQGVEIINLSLGEPDFSTPYFICQAAKQAIDEGYHGYSPVPGYMDLREVIKDKLFRENNISVTAQQIVVSTGAKQSIANLLMATLNPGDEVILPTPYWVSYKDMVEFFGGKVVEVFSKVDQGFKITPQDLAKVITRKSKLFLFSNPSNPAGTLYSKEELMGLVEVLQRHSHILIASDEIYEHIRFEKDYFSIGSISQLKDRVVTINGLSKGFAMTGWRLGYLAAPLEIAKACSKIQSQITSGTCAITQRAAIAAIKEDGWTVTEQMRAKFLKRRDHLLELVQKHLTKVVYHKPGGAFYLFCDFSAYLTPAVKNTDELALYLLNEAKVAMTPGTAFGHPECLRLSFAVNEETLTQAVVSLKEALDKLL